MTSEAARVERQEKLATGWPPRQAVAAPAAPVVLVYALLLAIVAGAFLFSPPAPPRICAKAIGYGPASVTLNCDSPAYMALAIHPAGLFGWGQILQARPLYVAAAAPLAQALAPALVGRGLVPPQADEAWAFFTRQWRRISPGEAFAAHLAYVALNAAVVLAALLAFHRLVARRAMPTPSVLAFASLLAANDVLKAFFWTPHTQMFNVLVPVGCMAACRALLERADRGVAALAGLGVAVGGASLAYASFVLWVPAMAVALALGTTADGRRHGAWGWILRTAALIVGFLVPNLAWIGVCELAAGGYYNHAVTQFRQFVWMLDALDVGWGELASAWATNSRSFAAVAWSQLRFPLALLAGALACGAGAGVSPRAVVRADRATVVAALLTLGASLVFFDLQGFYEPRLAWNLVPPVVVCAALVERQIRRDAGRRWRVAASLASVAVAVGWAVHEVTKRGPWT